MVVDQPPAQRRVQVWTTGGFLAWLLERVFVLAIFFGVLFWLAMGLSDRRTGSSPRPLVRWAVVRAPDHSLLATGEHLTTQDRLAEVTYVVTHWRSGFPFRSEELESHWLVYSLNDPNITEAQCQTAIAAFLSTANFETTESWAALAKPHASRLATGRFTVSKPVYAGLLGNVGVGLAALMTVAAMMLSTRRAYLKHRANARAAVGFCPTCGFDMLGRFNEQCPECGNRVWTIESANAAARS